MWLTAIKLTLLCICFMLVIHVSKLILDYLDSKPAGMKTLMDELNKVFLYGFLLIIMSNYPVTIVLTLGLDLSQYKLVAATLAMMRYL